MSRIELSCNIEIRCTLKDMRCTDAIILTLFKVKKQEMSFRIEFNYPFASKFSFKTFIGKTELKMLPFSRRLPSHCTLIKQYFLPKTVPWMIKSRNSVLYQKGKEDTSRSLRSLRFSRLPIFVELFNLPKFTEPSMEPCAPPTWRPD